MAKRKGSRKITVDGIVWNVYIGKKFAEARNSETDEKILFDADECWFDRGPDWDPDRRYSISPDEIAKAISRRKVK